MKHGKIMFWQLFNPFRIVFLSSPIPQRRLLPRLLFPFAMCFGYTVTAIYYCVVLCWGFYSAVAVGFCRIKSLCAHKSGFQLGGVCAGVGKEKEQKGRVSIKVNDSWKSFSFPSLLIFFSNMEKFQLRKLLVCLHAGTGSRASES